MRETRNAQPSIFDFYSPHPLGEQFESLSDLVDGQPWVLALVEQDVRDPETSHTGANGLSIESIFRCLLLKQILQVSYEKLAFHLSDSPTYRSFARLESDQFPRRSSLQSAIRRIRPQTLEQLNTLHVSELIDSRTISIEKLRIDSTVTDSNISPPSDSQLLADSIRVLSRLMKQCKDKIGIKIRFTDQRDKSKSLSYKIFLSNKALKDELYPQLLSCANVVVKQSRRAIEQVELEGNGDDNQDRWIGKMTHFLDLFLRVIDQTQRRVYNDEKVPADEKVLSIFEPHTDIIVKGERDIQYGHKINLATQQDGFITYLNIEKGNPADSNLYQPVIVASQNDYKKLPISIVADGCYSSQENVKQAKVLGVQKNVFTKSAGLTLKDMGVQQKTRDALRNFRAGVEGNISELKRAFGAGKATWKGQDGFDAFVWASALCYNLVRAVRFSSA